MPRPGTVPARGSPAQVLDSRREPPPACRAPDQTNGGGGFGTRMLRWLTTGSICVAAVENAGLSFLPRFIADFGRRYPGLHLDISVAPFADVIARVFD